jgi:hypothetical protein
MGENLTALSYPTYLPSIVSYFVQIEHKDANTLDLSSAFSISRLKVLRSPKGRPSVNRDFRLRSHSEVAVRTVHVLLASKSGHSPRRIGCPRPLSARSGTKKPRPGLTIGRAALHLEAPQPLPPHRCGAPVHKHRGTWICPFMARARDSLPNQTVREREVRRDCEINVALKAEAATHAAKIKNMHRLRWQRLRREAQQRWRDRPAEE